MCNPDNQSNSSFMMIKFTKLLSVLGKLSVKRIFLKIHHGDEISTFA